MRRTLTSIAGTAALAITLSACGSSGGDKAGACTPVGSTVAVEALDKLTFDADSYNATAGCIELTYTNGGSVAHTLLVKGQSGFKLTIGRTDEGLLELDAGTYTLYCDVAGHEAGGMKAELTVA